MASVSLANANAQVAEKLAGVLSDTYVLLVKTHGYHWNVTGETFAQLHTLFETQYNELFEAVDEIAERIRALKVKAPVSMANFLAKTGIKESTDAPDAPSMIKSLLEANEALRLRAAQACDFAGEVGDKGSEDLLVGRLKAHDKAIWMLRSLIDD